jgi:ketosteroid isomerase-like protein
MSKDMRDFEQFMRRREEAAGAYVRGDAAPLGRLVAGTSPATFFSPKGDYREGADVVSATYKGDAASFEDGSENHFEILHMAASDGIAYWVGFQRALARIRGQSEPIPFNLRVTEVFRREGGEWKLIHRHADELKSAE